MSGYLRGSQLQRQLEEKLKETTRTRQVAEDALKAATEAVEAARKVDANVVEAEKVLADATAAAGNKDYKLAAEKAIEATERAQRIFHERTAAIIESGAGLVTLARGVGADVAEAEGLLSKARDALAAETLPEAVDLAKKAWKRSEKVLSEYLSSSFSKAQSLILSAKNLGRDVAAVEDLLSRSRTAVEGNNYQSALDFTKEALDTITEDLSSVMNKDLHDSEDLVRTAQELGGDVTRSTNLLDRSRADIAALEFDRASNALRQCRAEAEKALQKSLEGKIADFSKFIEEAQAIGADTTAAADAFAQAEAALKQGNVKAGAQAARQGFQILQDAQFARVVQTIGASREKFVAAVNLGVDLKDAIAYLNNAREALQRTAFRESLDWARKADAIVDTSVARIRQIQERLKELHRAFVEAERLGVSTIAARKAAERAREAYQAHDLDGVERSIDAAHEELQKAEREQVLRMIEGAEFVLTLGEQNGVDLSEASKVLEDAIVATKANEHGPALDLVGQAQAKAEAALRAHVQGRVSVLRNALLHLGPDGEALKEFIARAEAAMDSRDIEGAFRSLEEGRAFVEDRTRNEAERTVQSLGLAIQMGVDLGADIAAVEALHKELSAALARGNVADVLAARDRVLAALGTCTEALVTAIAGRIATAQSLKIDVQDMTEFLRRARMALGVQDYAEGLPLLMEAGERAGKATALHRQAYTALSGAAAVVAEARKHNVDVTKVIEVLVDAKKAFERLDYAQTLELSNKARSDTEKLTLLYTAAQRILANRERMELASKLGIEAPHLRELAEDAKEAMKAKDYERAVKGAGRSEEEYTTLIREKLLSILSTTESLAGSVEGVNLAQVNDETIRARQALETGELPRAVELVLHMRDTLERLKKQGEEAEGGIRHIRELLSDAEAMSLEVSSTSGLVDKAERGFKMGQFEEALDFVSQAEAELVQERDRGVAALIRRSEESIVRAKQQGTDTRSAEKLFERSREFFRAKKYRQALATAVQSEAEAERVALQQGMASQAVETIERKLKGLGRPAPFVERIADESRSSFVKGDYVKALDTAIKASDAFADYRLAFEETQEARIRAQALRQSARDVGAEAARLDGFIHDGDRALESGDLQAAEAAFGACVESGVALVRAHLNETLSGAEALALLCRKLDVDATSILNRLSEARSQIESENFTVAAKLIQAGHSDAQAALGARLNRSLQEAAENVAHAKKLGTDAGNAERLLQEANEKALRGDYESALDVANRALEQVESVKVVEKRFIDLTYKAETTIRNGKKFGIDMRPAEKRLAESMEARKRDLPEAIKSAEDAYRLAWDAVEAFAPNLKASLTVGPAQLNQWVDASVEVENVGKGLAKDVRVRVLGDAETEGLQPVVAVRARGKELLTFRIKMTAPGSVPLAIQIVSHRVFDDKEYVQEMIAQIEVAQTTQERAKKLVADLESRCPICKGVIKKGFKVIQCACGRDFHELCGSRVGRCPVCFRALGNPQ